MLATRDVSMSQPRPPQRWLRGCPGTQARLIWAIATTATERDDVMGLLHRRGINSQSFTHPALRRLHGMPLVQDLYGQLLAGTLEPQPQRASGTLSAVAGAAWSIAENCTRLDLSFPTHSCHPAMAPHRCAVAFWLASVESPAERELAQLIDIVSSGNRR